MEFNLPLLKNQSFDVVGFGLNAVDHLAVVPQFPQFGSKHLLSHYQLSVGGQVSTAMVTLARLGYKTSYVGKVGAEPLGDLQLASLGQEGVECTRVIRVEGAHTQLGLIMIEESTGERTILWHRDPRLTVQPEELIQEHITAGRLLHLDGCDVAAAIQAARWAKEAGVLVSIDIDTNYPGVEELIPLIDFLITSSEFPEMLTGQTDRHENLKYLKDRFGCRFVAMTLGREGALAYHNGDFIHSSAFTHFEIHDTTGAGDAFRGGFLYGVLQGYSVEETLRVANLVAALNCRRLGARAGLPTARELTSVLSASATE